jgi:ribonuclease HII
MGLRGVPLGELRRRYVRKGERASAAVRAALREDSRAGAVALLRSLELRRARAAAEKQRLRQLFRLERRLALDGVERVAGVDEVGMGPLAGPVVAASVVLPRRVWLPGLNDSKRLSAAARERLNAEIRSVTCEVSLGLATREEIDRLNIYQAGLLAMQRAVEGLCRRPDMLLVDARRVPGIEIRQRAVIGGDACVACIAAASIVAKVYRDGLMQELDRRYPGYGFAANAGYGTPAHRQALEERGPSPEHRHSFAPVSAAARRIAEF